ncbi:threonine-phosphate decarboxylase CobD [Acetonema longum]|uniref:threonine-phosphate decarboxylase n=1 Tax=Acetonema longum DSM 6540 TaxID=1009370 RepID=F7NPY1_9FIRM|nr:threonine-phosphate decarboxylase CobD [Acetonema longum]EGO61972.1 L-threonine-O-3-phosphate decarboxylase [Acetonema longum DSM 6540]
MRQQLTDVHGGNIHRLSRDQKVPWQSILDFSANINPCGLPASVRDCLAREIDSLVHYPDPQAFLLKQAISERYQVPVTSIVAGNGAVELLYILCHMINPKRVLVTAPTFSEYERAARAANAEICYYTLSPDNDFTYDAAVLEHLVARMDILFLGNPNNPTGSMLTNTEIEHLLACCQRHHCLVVVDESFIDFLPDDRDFTCRRLLDQNDHLVILQSLTKFYALPGLRLGFALCSERISQILHKGKDPWNVNSLAQAAGVAALKDVSYSETSKRIMHAAKDDFFRKLCAIPGWRPLKPVVNYILVDVGHTGRIAAEWQQLLMQRGVLIRDCSNYRGLSAAFIRLAVKLAEQNDALIHAITNCTGE